MPPNTVGLGMAWLKTWAKRKKATSSCCTAAATTLPGIDLRPNNGNFGKLSAEKAGCHCLTLPTEASAMAEEDAYGLRVFLKHTTELLDCQFLFQNFGMVITSASARSLWWPKMKKLQPAPTAKSKPSSVPCIPTQLSWVDTIALVLKNDGFESTMDCRTWMKCAAASKPCAKICWVAQGQRGQPKTLISLSNKTACSLSAAWLPNMLTVWKRVCHWCQPFRPH